MDNSRLLKPLAFDYKSFRQEYLKKRSAAYSATPNCPTAQAGIEKLLKKMVYGDALVRHGYRLEYVKLENGFPHYRLYKGRTLIGIQDVRSPKVLPRLWKKISVRLLQYGFTPQNSSLVICGSRTPPNASKWAAPRLL